MNSITIRKELKSLIGTVLFWFVAIFAYDIFRRLGASEMPGVTVDLQISRSENFVITAIMSIVTGVLYYMFEHFVEKPRLKRKSIGFQLVAKIVSYLVLLTFVINVGISLLSKAYNEPISFESGHALTSGAVWSFIAYFTLSSALFSFFKLVNEKFGPGVLWKMLLGKYQKPRVEKKIFMFLDLKSSTTIAEELGYEKYSALIQHCFYDLNEVVGVFSAEIYQYVGDEAVLSWDYEKGINQNECIDTYFAFRNKLHEKEEFYKSTFGRVPEFKAGLHGGELMVAEVGVVKKDIAYHGDVINTTARIQGMCNQLKAPLLISDTLLSELSLNKNFIQKFEGNFTLKGKEVSTKLHSISLLTE